MSWKPEKFKSRLGALQTRQRVIRQCRAYFDECGFTEVQTPILQIMGAPDTHIQQFQVGGGLELHSSPEIAMKKLLVAGMERIYQICPVFRREIAGRLHSEEFTMLEWYRVGADYTAMMNDCEGIIHSLGLYEGISFERLSVAEAFDRYAHIDLKGDLHAQAIKLGIRVIESDTFDDVFHAIMAEKIEPSLGLGGPAILYDYPPSMAALAKKRGEGPFQVAERFELYINGIEIANAFSELTDPAEQRARLEADLAAKRRIYGIESVLDEDFIAALDYGMPESAGCALGLDRLIMIAAGAQTIGDVQWSC